MVRGPPVSLKWRLSSPNALCRADQGLRQIGAFPDLRRTLRPPARDRRRVVLLLPAEIRAIRPPGSRAVRAGFSRLEPARPPQPRPAPGRSTQQGNRTPAPQAGVTSIPLRI